MKILLRDAHTRLFEAIDGTWTSNPQDACVYPSIRVAGEHAVTCCADRNIEVVLQYEEPPCQLALNPQYCIESPPAPRRGA